MRKALFTGLIVALVFILVGGVGVAYAQFRGLATNSVVTTINTQDGNQIVRQFGLGGKTGGDGFGYGPGGMMGGYGYGPGGMMGGYGPNGMMGGRGFNRGFGMMGERGFGSGQEYGVMHNYMISAFASAVGLTVDEVNTRLGNGETLTAIANAQGFTGDKLTTLITQVRQAALDQAVKDGVITQAQADTMLQHMNQYSGEGFGPGFGNCPMWDGDENPTP